MRNQMRAKWLFILTTLGATVSFASHTPGHVETSKYAPTYNTAQDILLNRPAMSPDSSMERDRAAAVMPEGNSYSDRNTAAAMGVTTEGMAASVNDDQIALILKTSNDAEINAAQLAKRRADNEHVKEYARMMIEDHQASNKDRRRVLRSANINSDKSEVSKTMKKDAREKISELRKSKGAEFDRAYMDMQIERHRNMLTDLDQKLIPAAQKPELRDFLKTTRSHVQNHLSRAQEVQSTLIQ
ncbi:MAG: hypothetical protein A2622_00250 [Bdellovibrionales bacterium RIFCSPHIGHO2_01_FULL_40_29]|nr:MAG: hypothetical protein A2622_00250 [Bdellovibrionales bacterium RIFCSPHIGHO2_01_FULL_40_29]OFZ32557.1 MAG: hypothetical protein A3D17_04850 [Bdellovibrionales bacterium RIFCSPHIGHO2_02_FULL_40_15]